jgi:hypothetical protein
MLHVCCDISSCLQATIASCQVRHNNATQGGAVFLQDQGHADITRCNFTANRAIDSAGAIYARLNSTFNLSFTTLDENHATGGGAVALHDTASGTAASIICAGNSAEVDGGCIRMESSQVSCCLKCGGSQQQLLPDACFSAGMWSPNNMPGSFVASCLCAGAARIVSGATAACVVHVCITLFALYCAGVVVIIQQQRTVPHVCNPFPVLLSFN